MQAAKARARPENNLNTRGRRRGPLRPISILTSENIFHASIANIRLIYGVCSASESSSSSYAVESLSSGSSSERPDSPLSLVDFNWDMMDDDIADIPEGVL